MNPWQSDSKTTDERIGRLGRYFGNNVMTDGGDFVCRFASSCRSSHQNKTPGGVFYEGQLHHVGKHYDLSVRGCDFRVVVIGQEYGHNPMHCGTTDRHYMIAEESGLNRRFHAGDGHIARNPHMRGTTSLLRLAFGLGLGSDHQGEFLQVGGESVHIFDASALINCLMCSAVGPGNPPPSTRYVPEDVRQGTRGCSTKTMQSNCTNHLRHSLCILQPTLIVVQGKEAQRWIARAGFIKVRNRILTPVREGNQGRLDYVEYGGNRALLAGFSHPSARSPLGWGSNDHQAYLLNTVKPTIEEARRLLLG